jgi:hypothetical protein
VDGELSRYQSCKAWLACRLLPLGWMDNFHAIKAALADSCKPKMAAAADSCPWGGWIIFTLSKLPLLTAANQRWLLLPIAAPGVDGELSRYQSCKAWLAAAACCPWGGWIISMPSMLPLLTAANQRWLLLLIAAHGVDG